MCSVESGDYIAFHFSRGVAGIICKLVGVLYRIPLTNIITQDGMGVYSTVYPTYNLLLTISSAGLPVAISRMMASGSPISRHRPSWICAWPA